MGSDLEWSWESEITVWSGISEDIDGSDCNVGISSNNCTSSGVEDSDGIVDIVSSGINLSVKSNVQSELVIWSLEEDQLSLWLEPLGYLSSGGPVRWGESLRSSVIGGISGCISSSCTIVSTSSIDCVVRSSVISS